MLNQKCFWQLSEGLHFLHDSVKMLHRNLGPESIILNHQGAWKIFGFDFCVANCAPANQVHKIGIHHGAVYVCSQSSLLGLNPNVRGDCHTVLKLNNFSTE